MTDGNSSSTISGTLDSSKVEIVLTIRTIFSVLSIIAIIFNIMLILSKSRWWRNQNNRLLFPLILSAAVLCISFLLSNGRQNDRGTCIAQGFLIQASRMAIIGWNTVISVNFFLAVYLEHKTVKYEKYYHISVWLWTILASVIEFINGPYVYTYSRIVWCWISVRYPIHRFVFFLGPGLLQIVLQVVLFSIVFVRLHKKEQSKDVVYSLLGFPLISMMVVIIPFIHCIYDALSGDESFVLYILQCFSGPAVGVYIFIAYCMDKDMKIRLAIMCDPDPVIVHKSDPDNEDNEMDSESNRTSNIPNNNEESVVDVSQEKKNVNGQ